MNRIIRHIIKVAMALDLIGMLLANIIDKHVLAFICAIFFGALGALHLLLFVLDKKKIGTTCN